jgi:hypothetical protein
MAKKIKKRPSTSVVQVDPNLEEVGEERAFEVELDEEACEVVFVNHYRTKWGDGFDADTEHGLNLDEAKQLMGVLFKMISYIEEILKSEVAAALEEKTTIDPIEKNPMKDNSVQ